MGPCSSWKNLCRGAEVSQQDWQPGRALDQAVHSDSLQDWLSSVMCSLPLDAVWLDPVRRLAGFLSVSKGRKELPGNLCEPPLWTPCPLLRDPPPRQADQATLFLWGHVDQSPAREEDRGAQYMELLVPQGQSF